MDVAVTDYERTLANVVPAAVSRLPECDLDGVRWHIGLQRTQDMSRAYEIGVAKYGDPNWVCMSENPDYAVFYFG